jgi:cytoskeletal protein RodZ
MNKEEPYRDQAEKLKQRIEKYKEPVFEETETSMPPRSELHRNKKKKAKVKVKFPLIRLLALFFILLPITIFSIYTYMGNKHIGTVKTSVPSKGYETINFENSKNEQSKQNTNSSEPKKNSKQNNHNTDSTIKN